MSELGYCLVEELIDRPGNRTFSSKSLFEIQLGTQLLSSIQEGTQAVSCRPKRRFFPVLARRRLAKKSQDSESHVPDHPACH